MQVSEIMSKGIVCVNSEDSIRKVAELMRDEDVGALPVLENDRPVGIVTDRDIVITCVATGYDLEKPVSHAMSDQVISVKENQDIMEVSKLMQENKVSRILVTDNQEHPIGMVSLQDLSFEDEDIAAETVSRIKDE
jgi:CBS domain-containing protein